MLGQKSFIGNRHSGFYLDKYGYVCSYAYSIILAVTGLDGVITYLYSTPHKP